MLREDCFLEVVVVQGSSDATATKKRVLACLARKTTRNHFKKRVDACGCDA